MFRAVNTESEFEKRRCLSERQKIQNLYISSAKSLNIDRFLSFKVSFDQNQPLYDNAKSNLLFSLVNKSKVENLLELSKKYGILESKQAFFEFVRMFIRDGKFVQSRKLINLAKTKGWFCNEFFELKNFIENEYFGGAKLRKKVVFDDLL